MRLFIVILFAVVLAVQAFSFPLSFEKRNATHFLTRLPNSTADLYPDHVNLRDITLRFVGSAPAARFEGLGHAGPSTYLRAGFSRTFPQYPRLAIRGLYPGIDAIFYGNGENLEYDLQLTSARSLDRARILVDGAHSIEIDKQGNLSIRTASGLLSQMRPRVFQRGREISAQYVLLSANEVGVKLGKHDRRAPLTVDPVLTYTKTFGGTGFNQANQIATDPQGNIYVAGQTYGLDFPTTANSFEPTSVPTLRILTDAGQTISPSRPGTALSVGTVGATPDGKILYAGTSQGILLSVDSGATWKQTAPLPLQGGPKGYQVSVTSISIDLFDPATLLVGTNAGLFGSDIAGGGWGARTAGMNVTGSGFVSIATVFYDPRNPYIAYAVSSGPSYLFASSDAGNTWRRLEPTYPGEPPADTFTFSPNQAATISPDGSILYSINGNGTLLKSPDGGKSWVKLASGFFAPVSIQVDPSNPSTLYVLDYRNLHKSTDGGATFKDVTGTPAQTRSVAVDSTGAVYVSGLTAPVYVSTDGAQTFAPVSNLAGPSTPTLSASGNKVYVGSYATTVPYVLKLDPTGQNILYSTFLGGSSGDSVSGLAVDSQGNAIVAGAMNSVDFPLTTPAASLPGPGKQDGFIAKLSADGTRLIYATALAASKSVTAQAVTVDSSGAVFVTGQSYGTDLPTTPGSFQPAVPLAPCTRQTQTILGPPIPLGNAYVSKFAADGKSPVYTTLLTGACGSFSNSIVIDSSGNAIVAGLTTSSDFPITAGAYQPAFPGPLDITKPGGVLNAGFVSKISPAGDKLLASTFLGGGYSTTANSVALDASGNPYVTGFTQGFATGATPGAFQTKFVDTCAPTIHIGPGGSPYTGTGDAFALKLDPTLSTAGFLTYLGGGCNDSGSHIALDPSGNIWITGIATSADFPLKTPFQSKPIDSSMYGFVSELNPNASQLLFSSFAEGAALALGPSSVYLAGSTGTSAFVARIDPTNTTPISIDSVGPVTPFPSTSTAPSFTGIAPGQLIQITGRNLGPADKASAKLDASGRLPFVLANTVVFFDNVPAPMLSVDATTIQCFVPFEVLSTTKVTVVSNGQTSNAVKISLSISAPQVLSIVNQDGTINSADHPAKAGSVISLYVSGLGQTNPPGADGLLNSAPLPVPIAGVTVYFPTASSPTTPQYVAAAMGMIAGISQVNVQLPASIPISGTKPIVFSVNATTATLYTAQ